MEICGSIFTDSEYSRFYLKCIYCSIESELKDWQEFVSHIRNVHSVDEADAQSSKQDFGSGENVNNSLKDKVIEIWAEDDSEFNTNYEYLDPQSPTGTEASAFPATNSIDGTLDTMDHDELNLVDGEVEVMSEFLEDNILDDSIDYENEEESSSHDSGSDEEINENPRKRSRTNPMTLKRKLKVSFLRHNPRVLCFIEEFKKHPCLWNPDNPKFSDEKARTESYRAIIEVMDKKVNVLFTDRELKKTIGQLLAQYAIATENSEQEKLTGMPARYFDRCKFLSISVGGAAQTDVEESKSDVIQLNFKDMNEMTSNFIDVYANFPVLYDSSLPEFKCIDARTDAYIKMAEGLAPEMRVNETEVHMAVVRLRKWTYMSLRRVKSKVLQRPCSKTELHYLQQCSFLPSQKESITFNCEVCDKKFFIDYLLRTHMVKAHNIGELPYLCSQCPRRFEKNYDMERHKLRLHCEKKLKCDYCESTFSLSNDLNVHTRVHTGEKPFVCEICGKAFRLKLLLDYHINGFHLDLRPFSCDLCHKTFRKRVHLKNHMKAHLNIKDKKCDICAAAFSCPTSLSRHRKSHFVQQQSQLH